MKNLIALLFLVISLNSLASVKITLFGMGQSQSIFRGAVTYSKPSAMLGPSFTFFDSIVLAGPNIFFKAGDRNKDSVTYKIGVRYIDDNVPMFVSESKNDFKNQRRNTIESYAEASYRFGWRNKFGFSTELMKEWKRHKKSMATFSAFAPILPFTSLKGTISLAQKEMNQYIYGPSGTSGVGFSSLNINTVIPFVPWEGIAMLGATQYWINKEANQNAEYIRGDDKNMNFYFRIIWNVL
ncbi:MAG: hypothetical protein GY909_03395 [Oligoflexia bacterium]|nr:hypothetical protein [Oligoflexia bacterium]